MARAFVIGFERSSQQPTDGTANIEVDTVVSGTEVLNGSYLFGVQVNVDPLNDSVNDVQNRCAAAIRDFAGVHIPNTDMALGVTIPANGVMICGLSKA